MTTPKKASGRLKIAVDDTVKKVNREAASRGMRAVNAIRNAELEVFVDVNKIDHLGSFTAMDDHFAALGIVV